MEQRRLMNFLATSLLLFILWQNFIVPAWFPRPPLKKPGQAVPGDRLLELLADEPADALFPWNTEQGKTQAALSAKPQLDEHPLKTVTLGSPDPQSPYFLDVELSSRGASISHIALNDPRYVDLASRKDPLKVVSQWPNQNLRTFSLSEEAINAQLRPFETSLNEVSWEVVPDSQSESAVTFRFVTPDRKLELTKRYELVSLSDAEQKTAHIRDTYAAGYRVKLTLGMKNLSTTAQEVQYQLTGPVGVPLEDVYNTYKFRDIQLGFLQEKGTGVDVSSLASKKVIDQEKAEKPENWKRPIQYIGVDVQFFAALVRPLGNQVTSPIVETASPIVLVKNGDVPERSDISVNLTSVKVPLAGKAGGNGESVEHAYELYAGPKRRELLTEWKADDLVAYGWFAVLCNLMLAILNGLHLLGINYGVAIIILTVIVRIIILPLSKKQSDSMHKMKELQPKIKELQQKFKDDKEGLSRAQMDLMAKHGANPFSGCFTAFLQLPIFIALYRTLSTAIDLRLAPFLWAHNLAAPDALFPLGFEVPWFGWTEFNVFPILSLGIIMIQQQLTMPPPADEEQAMQYRVMKVMMVVMSAMFYRLPSGLGIYFITSSLWGITERFLFDKWRLKYPPKPFNPDDKNRKPSMFGQFWEKIQEAADKERELRKNPGNNRSR